MKRRGERREAWPGMAIVDWIIAAIVILAVIGAWKNGFFVEAFSLGGVVLGLLIASWNYQRLMPSLLQVSA